jgi:predicted nucleic acid-binding protein
VIIVDSAIWIDHFRSTDRVLERLLAANQVAIHPMVLVELSLGRIPDRASTLGVLGAMYRPQVASDAEVQVFIDLHRLVGAGIGYVDAHLLASARVDPRVAGIRTRDKAMLRTAAHLDVATY